MSLIEHINLTDGFNINPISLEFGNEMTTTKFLYSLQSKINNFIDDCNGVLGQANNYTDEEIAKINKSIKEITDMIADGSIVKDGSLTFKKMNSSFIDDFQEFIIQKVYETTKFVFFGLDKDYFCAYFPDTWDDMTFSTTEEGNLCLEY